MTVDEVVREIERAMQTLKNLPLGEASLLSRVKALWPEVLRSERENWWSEPSVKHNREVASSQDIDRLDRVLGWLMCLTDYERMVVSARAEGASWRAIMWKRRKLKLRSHEGHRQVWRRAVEKIAYHFP